VWSDADASLAFVKISGVIVTLGCFFVALFRGRISLRGMRKRSGHQ